jgi:TPR repeat protein
MNLYNGALIHSEKEEYDEVFKKCILLLKDTKDGNDIYNEGYSLAFSTLPNISKKVVPWLENLATQKISPCMLLLGIVYAKKKSVICYDKAIYWLKESIKSGNIVAYTALGKMYYNGIGVKQNHRKAAELLHKAPDCDNVNYYLSQIYIIGKDVKQDDIKGFEYLFKSAEQGNKDALFFLGMIYHDNEEYNLAFEYLIESANKGHENACYKVSTMYLTGAGVEKDKCKATKWIEKCAKLGSADAQFNIGVSYYFGIEIDKDINNGLEWLIKSAEQDHLKAIEQLYRINIELYNNKEAIKWLIKGTQLGCPKLQYDLAKLHQQGLIFNKDIDKAIEHYTKSAEQGYKYAQRELGEILLERKVFRPAIKWLRKASEQGLSEPLVLALKFHEHSVEEYLNIEDRYIEASKEIVRLKSMNQIRKIVNIPEVIIEAISEY